MLVARLLLIVVLLGAPSYAQNPALDWGPWYVLGPFDHPLGARNIDEPQRVENDLRHMRVDGPGPRLETAHRGKGKRPFAWTLVAGESRACDVGPIDLAMALTVSEEAKAQGKAWTDRSVAYLYRTIVCDATVEIPVSCGSNDGLRLWLNGELLVDIARKRRLNPSAHGLSLFLEEGVNHLLAKISNDDGDWAFQLTERKLDQLAIDAAIDSGAEHLIETQLLDGSWEQHSNYMAGATAYAGYCLLKCGVSRDHPAVQRARSYVLQHPSPYNYSTACELLFLCTLASPDDRPVIERRLGSMLDWQHGSGLFRYPVNPGGTSHDDLSLTLFSTLALSAVEVYGVDVDDRVWTGLIEGALACFEGLTRSRASKGATAGFSYRPGGRVTGSMTTAGIGVLHLAREGLGGEAPARLRPRFETAMKAGLGWLEGRMDWDKNPGAGSGHHYFWLYGVERVGSLLELEKLGGVSWYADGSHYLLSAQHASGAWGGTVDTILALLFLKRASSRIASVSGVRAQADGRWKTSDAEAPISIVATGSQVFAVWVNGVHDSVRERLGWEDGSLRVLRVEFHATPVGGGSVIALGTVDGNLDRPDRDQRFAVHGALPRRGEWDLVARMHLLPPPQDADGEDTAEIVESPPLRVLVKAVLSAGQLDYASEGTSNLFVARGVACEASSSVNKQAVPEYAADGRQGTAWRCEAKDTEPWLRLRPKRAVMSTCLYFSHASPRRSQADAPRAERVVVLINRKVVGEVTMDPDPLKKTVFELGREMKVSVVELRILSLHGAQLGKASVGFGEVELLRAR